MKSQCKVDFYQKYLYKQQNKFKIPHTLSEMTCMRIFYIYKYFLYINQKKIEYGRNTSNL